MASKEDQREVVYDEKTKTKYLQGRFLGKGGFAKCYEFYNMRTNITYAGKVISKSMLTKEQHKEKVSQEIAIHRSLSHNYIVAFHSYFEDEKNVYIVLELCRKRSLMEMHKRRKVLTEPEVRYFVRQIILACIYLHQNKVIHRDLKLGNLFINDDMEVKVGDFGLATRISYDGERKKTVCGTPNYIAPEILNKKGHSYEVDVWSLGCIMYTLLVGKPPFETHTLPDTYSRIKKNEYHIPSKMGKAAKLLIQQMLRHDPKTRPNMKDILTDDFFILGHLPSRLPVSCLTMPPRFGAKIVESSSKPERVNATQVTTRRPLLEINKDSPVPQLVKKLNNKCEDMNLDGCDINKQEKPSFEVPSDYYLSDLLKMLKSVLEKIPKVKDKQYDEAQDPAAIPFIWISKWVDYTDKYGLGYQLCDNSVGVLFNDSTRLILLADGQSFHYIERDGSENYHNMQNYPGSLNKKVTLLRYFRTYMTDNLLKAGESATAREGDELTQVPYLRAWFRSRCAMVFHLTNGTLQINFFEDHAKIILCPLMGAVSYIDEKKEFTVYRLKQIEEFGCTPALASRLEYAKLMIEKLMSGQVVAGKVMNIKASTNAKK